MICREFYSGNETIPDHKDNINTSNLVALKKKKNRGNLVTYIGYIQYSIEDVISLRTCLEKFFANGSHLPHSPQI